MTRVVVASGKGGTGKTLVATSLALVASEQAPTALYDADVEAPNDALLLPVRELGSHAVNTLVPVIDEARCTHCGRCAEVCAYHAIAALPARVLVFPEMCHGCGSCTLNCPAGAISETPHPIGTLRQGRTEPCGIAFSEGLLQVGEAMATPVIRELLQPLAGDGRDWQIIDAPPGTACPVIEALRAAEVALLVTEPTPFGLHDLQLAVGLARDVLRLPVGVVLNKDDGQDPAVERYCAAEDLPILLRLPYSWEIAQAYARGRPLVAALPEYRESFAEVLRELEALASAPAREEVAP